MKKGLQLVGLGNPAFLLMLAAVVPVFGVESSRGLTWDATKKEKQVEAGTSEETFQFHVANETRQAVTIKKIRTSCGCTVAKAPQMPWTLAPKEEGDIDVTVDLRGRMGRITKSVFVDTTTGMESLTVQVTMPRMASSGTGLSRRQRNQLKALRDPQAIFKSDCAQCHVKPARGEHGKSLYQAACAICHEAHNRASMVPDLRELDHPTGRQFWRRWITQGKEGKMMPGFASSEGGPLTEKQVDSLVAYLQSSITERRSKESQSADGHNASKGSSAAGEDGTSSSDVFLPVPSLFEDEE